MRRFFTVCCMAFLGMLSMESSYANQYDFSLNGPDGVVTNHSFPGKYLVVFFGYTNCPDICPTALYEISQMLKTVKHPEEIQPILVSVDPTVDSLDKLNQYAHYFNPKMVGVTADYQTLKKMTDSYGASFGYRFGGKEVIPPDLPEPHSVYHSTLIYLLDPNGKIVDVFDYQIGYEELTKQIDAAMAHQPVLAPQKKTEIAQIKSNSCPLPKDFSAFGPNLPTLYDATKQKIDSPTLVNYWALWCGPCREELPLLDDLSASQKHLAILAINLDDEKKAIEKIFTDWKIKHLTTLQAKNSNALNAFHGFGLPFSVIFDKGEPVATHSGVLRDTKSIIKWAECVEAQHE